MNEYRPKSKILIVDDSEMSRTLLADMLEDKYDILEAENGVEAMDILHTRNDEIDLILLDVVMPKMDGFEVLLMMNQYHWIESIPVIMISSESSESYIERAYSLGVSDYISRPFEFFIVRRRIENTLMLYAKQKRLVGMVSDMFFEREKSNNMLIDILSHIVEFQNGESGLHVLHIHVITEILLNHLRAKSDKYNLTQSDVQLITLVSALHDIGKIGIPGEILNKPGRLTPEEFEIIKTHTTIGATMLMSLSDYKDEPLVKVAYEVCRWHHERYDGRGYPDGLVGDDIPISAQVVAIADVYDALTNERCYKKAFSHEKAIDMICNGECGQFQPMLIECLREVESRIRIELSESSTRLQNKRSMQSIMELLEQTESFVDDEDVKSDVESNDDWDGVISYDKDQTIKVNSAELAELFDGLRKVFGTVRLVNVSNCTQIETDCNGNVTESKHRCHEIWKKSERCENCISQKAFQSKKQMTKLEFIDSELYCVIANYIEVDDKPYVMELVLKANDDILLANGAKNGKAYLQINLEEYNKRLYTDSLTGAHNRRFYNEKVSKWGKADGIAMIDIDSFKQINDRYGHDVGDIVLKKLTAVIKSCIRESDFVIRYGGDEFLLIFPSIPEKTFRLRLDRVRQVVSALKIDDYPDINLTVSIGGMYDVHPISDAVKNADELMYDVKQSGKNAVKTSGDDE